MVVWLGHHKLHYEEGIQYKILICWFAAQETFAIIINANIFVETVKKKMSGLSDQDYSLLNKIYIFFFTHAKYPW